MKCPNCEQELTCHQNPALSDLAEILHVNVNCLGGVIRRAGGKWFRELLSERRMQKAEFLLRHYLRKYSIGEIGRRCGFSDSNYFCTVFKNRVGLSLPGNLFIAAKKRPRKILRISPLFISRVLRLGKAAPHNRSTKRIYPGFCRSRRDCAQREFRAGRSFSAEP